MDVFEILDIVVDLAPAGLVVLGLVAAYLILLYAVITFVEEAGQLRTDLFRVESELQALRDQFPQKRRFIAQLKSEIGPMRKDFRQLCDYYSELRQIENEAERAAMEEAEEPQHEISVRDNLDILPVLPQWSLAAAALNERPIASTRAVLGRNN